jgi:hypothetical protein
MTKRGHRVYYRHEEPQPAHVPLYVWAGVLLTAALVIAATLAHYAQ